MSSLLFNLILETLNNFFITISEKMVRNSNTALTVAQLGIFIDVFLIPASQIDKLLNYYHTQTNINLSQFVATVVAIGKFKSAVL